MNNDPFSIDKRAPGAPVPVHEPGIPCCVPYWEASAFLQAGGRYTRDCGFFVDKDTYLPEVHEWLPRKYQDRGSPAVPVMLPDMLPTTAWQANLRTILSKDEWGRLRKFCYQAAGNTCVACGSRGEPHVEAHEAWRFMESTGQQVLTGLLCLCPTCHKAKHLGFARRIGRLDAVLERLMWLNDWDRLALDNALETVQARQIRLSERSWTLDLSFLQRYGVK